MKANINIKMDANTKVIIWWTLILIIILLIVVFLADHKEGFIVVNQMMYENCTCPEYPSYVPYMSYYTTTVSPNETITIITDKSTYYDSWKKCCYPNEHNCTYDCIYPIGIYYENKSDG